MYMYGQVQLDLSEPVRIHICRVFPRRRYATLGLNGKGQIIPICG